MNRLIPVFFFSVLLLSSCGSRRKIIVTNPVSPEGPSKRTDNAKRDSLLNLRTKGESSTKIISLMLPLRLNQMGSRSRSEIERSSLSLNLYQGMRLALDSLSAQSQGLQLNVLDTRDDSSHVSTILNSAEISKSKIIIGPVYPSEIRQITEFAKKTHTYFISPLSPQALSNFRNPYLVMVNCPLDAYAVRTASYIKDTYPDAKLIFVHNSEADEKFISPMKEKIQGTDLSIRGNSGFEAIKQALSADKHNVLIVPSLDKSFWAKLMVYLSPMSGANLTLFAHPGFERMHFNNNDILKGMDLHFASNYFIDRNSASVQNFIRKYKEVWFSQPDEYAFIGFDIGMFFGTMVIKGEVPATALRGSTYQGLSNNMEFQESPGFGYWNQSIKILSYGQGQLAEVK